MGRRVAIAGSSGLLGGAVAEALRGRGDTVVPLLRAQSRPAEGPGIAFDPTHGQVPDLGSFDAVLCLNGTPVAGRRWTGAVKQELRDSRIEPTAILAEAAARAAVPVYLASSAVGIYGDAGEITCIDGPDGTAPGSGFLADLCAEWEAAAVPPVGATTRVAQLRFGQVLSNSGGMLAVMRRIYRLGLGGRLGSGHQWISWIEREDAARAVVHVLDGALSGAISGPVNITGPAPARQQAFSEALGRAIGRPAPWVVPRVALRAAVGEVADEALLSSQRAVPTVLQDTKFQFIHSALPGALDAALADGGVASFSMASRSARADSGELVVEDLGTIGYAEAFDLQHDLAIQRADDEIHDRLLLLEHPPTFTAGRRTAPEDRPTDGSVVIDVDRGGKITWHGPGQLVGYPIIKLASPVDVVDYVRRIEQALIEVCAQLGLKAVRAPGRSGVWFPAARGLPERKVGAIGIRVARGVTLHGFSLNCDNSLGGFGAIIPCGIPDAGVTTLSAELGRQVTVGDIRDAVAAAVTSALNGDLPVATTDPILGDAERV